MRVRKAAHLALSLLVAAGLSVSAAGKAQGASAKKPSARSKSSGKSHRGKKVSRRTRGQKTPDPERISKIQEALSKDGSFSGTPNGKWDDATVEAMKKFQESHGLNPTGKLDAKTLQKLGLGSETTGVAPPLPPVSSSAVIAPSSRTTPRPQQ
jgi:peptidoglycan hydrolase-like protein with peptidoglycan-binding domain